MDVFEAISARRSIRRFKSDPVPDELVARLLAAATLAPSGKNRQPWRFVVVRGDEKRAEMVELMREGIAELRGQGIDVGSAEGSARAMALAPVTILVYNPFGKGLDESRSFGDNIWEIVDVQSVGGAIEHICLAATALGLGTLWICDVFVATERFGSWLGQSGQLVAAVSIGYPDESPGPRPRRSVEDVTTWL